MFKNSLWEWFAKGNKKKRKKGRSPRKPAEAHSFPPAQAALRPSRPAQRARLPSLPPCLIDLRAHMSAESSPTSSRVRAGDFLRPNRSRNPRISFQRRQTEPYKVLSQEPRTPFASKPQNPNPRCPIWAWLDLAEQSSSRRHRKLHTRVLGLRKVLRWARGELLFRPAFFFCSLATGKGRSVAPVSFKGSGHGATAPELTAGRPAVVWFPLRVFSRSIEIRCARTEDTPSGVILLKRPPGSEESTRRPLAYPLFYAF